MSWFSQILENWISSPYLEEYLTSVVHPLWLLKLLILLYSPVIAILLFLWAFSFVLHIYKKMNNQQESDSNFWEKPRKRMALVSDIVGKIWFGYEVIGMEHIPKGPGVIVYYHAVTAIDYSLLVAKLFKETQRKCYSVIDHAIYQVPGLNIFFDTVGLKDFSKAECVEILKNGHFIGISPGGSREANFSNDYSLMWGKRTGFAQIALEAKVPIIPMFTQNVREAFRNIGRTRLTRWLYEKTRLLYLPIYGPFPVKMRTYIGEPIPYDPNITAAELAEKTKTAMENLRDKYQKRPGNILRALSERFDKHYKAN
ncbi:monoacylglycerol/Diacylglycerol O-acyltransferase-like isoform X1 [Zootoca vivipara]|uniref:monoacylglycerol/Diacylglycerol O-acyltransferase-like isoform X1 n=1 Tax=Zootoca vivipara TaxID=8524 RepID=UPI00293B8CC1|nr:monoacylglycerol/Diacylglycerol O-acyltransferase-like isoform X1 [Zootoca vivipara]XP_060133796.1 monoacylglycerol/Diacylglycerol O-acyltransferase-like isoform X1 [Zootoca vivipara]XP_060133797.1 monoacylglycerol/Diacylglycerol O-acyltransferase-like isoform X1 [Zootoca vivipara]